MYFIKALQCFRRWFPVRTGVGFGVEKEQVGVAVPRVVVACAAGRQRVAVFAVQQGSRAQADVYIIKDMVFTQILEIPVFNHGVRN
ncbi:hypothetical protein D3C86_1840520 [compost metagenome]